MCAYNTVRVSDVSSNMFQGSMWLFVRGTITWSIEWVIWSTRRLDPTLEDPTRGYITIYANFYSLNCSMVGHSPSWKSKCGKNKETWNWKEIQTIKTSVLGHSQKHWPQKRFSPATTCIFGIQHGIYFRTCAEGATFVLKNWFHWNY